MESRSRRAVYALGMSPDTMLHWHCDGVTFSVKRLNQHAGILFVTGPGNLRRRGKRDIPVAIIDAWRLMPEKQRCEEAERELAA